jgi:biotin carboxyl carrier protein
MIPNRSGEVRVVSSFDGEVEIRVRVGQKVATGQLLAVVEGDAEIESFSVRNPSIVQEVLVVSGEEAPKGTPLLVLKELSE